MKKLIFILFALIFIETVWAEEISYYYYRPEINYGSEVMFNPINLFLNGSYDIFRNGAHSKHLFDQPYKDGLENVFDNLTHPKHNIDLYGYQNFIRREIGNLNMDVRSSQFLPNIGLHVLGNGMQYVKLSEWYDYHHYPVPKLLSAATTISYQLMNEILENGSFQGANVDPISDLLIFNPIGFALFSVPGVNRFFSTTLPLYDWSPQPVVTLSDLNIHNAGQQYATKFPIKKSDKYSLFMNWGVSSVVGLSYKFKEDKSISLGAGGIVNLLEPKQSKSENSRYMSPGMDFALALYYDKNESLLASFLLSGPKYYNFRMNIYPGLLQIKNISPGVFLAAGELDKFVMGVTVEFLPVGFGI
jgi:hypothetical protein